VSLAYRGTLRPVHFPDCIPPIGPWTTTPDMQHYFERREGTIPLEVHTISRGLWGALFFSVIALSHSPHTIALPLQLVWLCSQLYCAQFIVLTGSTYPFRNLHIFFLPRQLSPQEPHCHLWIQACVFVRLSVSMAACLSCLCRKTLGHFGTLISFCAHSLLMKMHISQSRD
jgi:hypothetical protein